MCQFMQFSNPKGSTGMQGGQTMLNSAKGRGREIAATYLGDPPDQPPRFLWIRLFPVPRFQTDQPPKILFENPLLGELKLFLPSWMQKEPYPQLQHPRRSSGVPPAVHAGRHLNIFWRWARLARSALRAAVRPDGGKSTDREKAGPGKCRTWSECPQTPLR